MTILGHSCAEKAANQGATPPGSTPGAKADTVRQVEHSYVGPAFEAARVHDAMRVGVVTCGPETKLGDVSRMMVGYEVHSVVVSGVGGEGACGES